METPRLRPKEPKTITFYFTPLPQLKLAFYVASLCLSEGRPQTLDEDSGLSQFLTKDSGLSHVLTKEFGL
jgi:hypothetical protein